MPNFKWAENAKAVYDRSIEATPFFFRSNTRDGLNKLLMERFGENTPITEAMLVKVIRENTPAAFVGLGMKAIAPVLTDKSLAEP